MASRYAAIARAVDDAAARYDLPPEILALMNRLATVRAALQTAIEGG
ncbi:MAG: hypothetical protein V2A73_03745 [Pseudomonadota bacterium]